MTRKEEILTVVLDLLSRMDNPKKLSVSNVAEELSIGKSTIYEYFTNKDELICGALDLLFERNLATLLDIEDFTTLSFEEAFKSHLSRFIDLSKNNEIMQNYVHHPDIATLPMDKKQALMESMHETFETIKKRLYDIFDKGIEEDLLKGPISDTRKQTIEALIFGAVVAISDPMNNWDVPTMIDDVYNSIILLHK